ncbi:hypothetical protein CI41S_66480 [Bradyrhizobium ivorense]|nr:hypothetical protein CI41S_66480 [Bradyrhizobium ivorense]
MRQSGGPRRVRTIHPTKMQIVYCKYTRVKFDFLGYQFRPQQVAT